MELTYRPTLDDYRKFKKVARVRIVSQASGWKQVAGALPVPLVLLPTVAALILLTKPRRPARGPGCSRRLCPGYRKLGDREWVGGPPAPRRLAGGRLAAERAAPDGERRRRHQRSHRQGLHLDHPAFMVPSATSRSRPGSSCCGATALRAWSFPPAHWRPRPRVTSSRSPASVSRRPPRRDTSARCGHDCEIVDSAWRYTRDYDCVSGLRRGMTVGPLAQQSHGRSGAKG
jgi:hypothetical protein